VKFVLDTNAVSEIAKPRPNAGFIAWHDSQTPANLLITTITLAEVWQGFLALPSNHREYGRLKKFATDLDGFYRVLNFDSRAAATWGQIATQAAGPLPLRDSFIAAIALSRGHRVVTRDATVFQRMGCRVENPWT
jgi:hypothetical protein